MVWFAVLSNCNWGMGNGVIGGSSHSRECVREKRRIAFFSSPFSSILINVRKSRLFEIRHSRVSTLGYFDPWLYSTNPPSFSFSTGSLLQNERTRVEQGFIQFCNRKVTFELPKKINYKG